MGEVSPAEIAVLTTEVRHLTDAVKKLLTTVDEQRATLEKKADVEAVQRLEKDMVLLFERDSTNKSRDQELKIKVTDLEVRVSKVEMETWKLGLMLGGSATAGGSLALMGQYLIGLLLL